MGRTALAALAALATSAVACTVPTSAGGPSELVGAGGAPIEGGKQINTGSDPVASLFPLSTVWLTSGCTGVIVSHNQVLTAAHCAVDDTTGVMFYPTTKGAGSKPISSSLIPIDATYGVNGMKVEDGVACSTTLGPSCYSTSGSGLHYADIAILTLIHDIDATQYKPVTLAPSGSYNVPHLGGVLNGTMWLVGTGYMNWEKNGCVSTTGASAPVQTSILNIDHTMQWVPLAGLSATDTNATVPEPNGTTAAFADGTLASGVGMFSTMLHGAAYSDPGDSGGPVFQYQLVASVGTLVLVGMQSGGEDCSNAARGSFDDRYTSLVYADNYNWLTGLIPSIAPAPDVATFGAAF